MIGSRLWVPDFPFACHTVLPGETLATIGETYDVEPSSIVGDGWNGLAADDGTATALLPGAYLRVPLATNGMAAPLPIDNSGFLPLMLSQPVGTAPELVRLVGDNLAETDLAAVGGPGLRYDAPVPAARTPHDKPFSGAGWLLYWCPFSSFPTAGSA